MAPNDQPRRAPSPVDISMLDPEILAQGAEAQDGQVQGHENSAQDGHQQPLQHQAQAALSSMSHDYQPFPPYQPYHPYHQPGYTGGYPVHNSNGSRQDSTPSLSNRNPYMVPDAIAREIHGGMTVSHQQPHPYHYHPIPGVSASSPGMINDPQYSPYASGPLPGDSSLFTNPTTGRLELPDVDTLDTAFHRHAREIEEAADRFEAGIARYRREREDIESLRERGYIARGGLPPHRRGFSNRRAQRELREMHRDIDRVFAPYLYSHSRQVREVHRGMERYFFERRSSPDPRQLRDVQREPERGFERRFSTNPGFDGVTLPPLDTRGVPRPRADVPSPFETPLQPGPSDYLAPDLRPRVVPQIRGHCCHCREPYTLYAREADLPNDGPSRAEGICFGCKTEFSLNNSRRPREAGKCTKCQQPRQREESGCCRLCGRALTHQHDLQHIVRQDDQPQENVRRVGPLGIPLTGVPQNRQLTAREIEEGEERLNNARSGFNPSDSRDLHSRRLEHERLDRLKQESNDRQQKMLDKYRGRRDQENRPAAIHDPIAALPPTSRYGTDCVPSPAKIRRLHGRGDVPPPLEEVRGHPSTGGDRDGACPANAAQETPATSVQPNEMLADIDLEDNSPTSEGFNTRLAGFGRPSRLVPRTSASTDASARNPSNEGAVVNATPIDSSASMGIRRGNPSGSATLFWNEATNDSVSRGSRNRNRNSSDEYVVVDNTPSNNAASLFGTVDPSDVEDYDINTTLATFGSLASGTHNPSDDELYSTDEPVATSISPDSHTLSPSNERVLHNNTSNATNNSLPTANTTSSNGPSNRESPAHEQSNQDEV